MRYKITCNGFPTVTISKLKKGEKIYAERNSCIASSPIYSEEDANRHIPTGALKRTRLMANELAGVDYTPEDKPTALSSWWSGFKKESELTMSRQFMGENIYVLYEALEDEQKVTFRSCFPGTIMVWDARQLADDEYYVSTADDETKSIFDDDNNRPHGTLMAVRGSFMAASLKVATKIYHTKDNDIVNLSETGDIFQCFSGNGLVFLEVHGDLQEIPLYPNESVDVFPGYLLGFTEGISLKMKQAGDVTLRKEESNDFVIRLTAGSKGGFVYVNSVKPKEFFRK